MKYLILLMASGMAFADTPVCYPPNATNFQLTFQPADSASWIAAANPSWVITWFCPGNGLNGYVGNYLVGYRSELLPNWSTIGTLSKASLDALWANQGAADAELLPLAKAQQAATWPQPLKTTGTSVYYVIQQPDKYVTIQVGTVPVGTLCTAQSVNGMNGVPVSSVKWLGNVKPLSVVAPCS